ncbi:MAG: SpoIIE family protein phosphatase [Bacteroidales bacterium]|nr:SpoIIE family protein phosphatase [Bacteroidales bacterium]
MKKLLKIIANSFNLRNVIIFVMPVSIAVLIIMLFNLSQTVDHLSHSLIKRTIAKTETELHDFFDPVISNLLMARDRGKGEVYEEINPEILNPFFVPVLKNSKQVSSLLLANSLGGEYMLLQEDSTWQNRITPIDSMEKVYRIRWKYDDYLQGEILEKWIKETDSANSPLKKIWFLEALENSYGDQPAWTEPYTFKTTKDPGITTSIKWQCRRDSSVTKVMAFDIMLTDISLFTTKLEISKNGMAFVFNQEDKVIGLPGVKEFMLIDSIKTNVLKEYKDIGVPQVNIAINQWKNEEKRTLEPFYFNFNGESWWCGVKEFKLSNKKSFYIAVIVPEADFLAEVNRTRTVIIAGFLLVTVLTLLVIRGYNQKRKANILLAKQKKEIEKQRDEIFQQKEEILMQKEEIEAQRDEIETQRDEIQEQKNVAEKQRDMITEQKQEITDSIHYAKRIQSALLPQQKFAAEILPEHFILFKPRDIVSGDFYWMFRKDNKVAITAADCTGHGVPGAFMSMLGIAFLNEIATSMSSLDASEILNLLRKQIINSLHQTGIEGGSKDGMDMSLCVIDTKENTIQFAGANNPLYIISNNEPEFVFSKNSEAIQLQDDLKEIAQNKYFTEIKADKMPIGYYLNNKVPYTSHCFKIQKEMSVYMFSDGFADQFGGPKGKKFKYKPFKGLLLENQKQTALSQMEVLDSEIEKWKSFTDLEGHNYEQVDDIVVIGLKF